MFRAPLCPLSGAHDDSVGYHIGRLALELLLDGSLSAGRLDEYPDLRSGYSSIFVTCTCDVAVNYSSIIKSSDSLFMPHTSTYESQIFSYCPSSSVAGVIIAVVFRTRMKVLELNRSWVRIQTYFTVTVSWKRPALIFWVWRFSVSAISVLSAYLISGVKVNHSDQCCFGNPVL